MVEKHHGIEAKALKITLFGVKNPSVDGVFFKNPVVGKSRRIDNGSPFNDALLFQTVILLPFLLLP